MGTGVKIAVSLAAVGAVVVVLAIAGQPPQHQITRTGIGEASSIVASKCSRFAWNSLLHGRCLDAYGAAYAAGKDLYSIKLDSDARPTVEPELPAGEIGTLETGADYHAAALASESLFKNDPVPMPAPSPPVARSKGKRHEKAHAAQ